ncbi:hypothetical protein M9435_001971 [Picochlorum sp. BPE23]|nr:hypothetical protein M9435_001971 [Picochlorum sp. BPE23]
MIPVALVALLLLAWRHVAGFEEKDVPSRWRSIDLLPQSLSPLYLISQKTCGNEYFSSDNLTVSAIRDKFGLPFIESQKLIKIQIEFAIRSSQCEKKKQVLFQLGNFAFNVGCMADTLVVGPTCSGQIGDMSSMLPIYLDHRYSIYIDILDDSTGHHSTMKKKIVSHIQETGLSTHAAKSWISQCQLPQRSTDFVLGDGKDFDTANAIIYSATMKVDDAGPPIPLPQDILAELRIVPEHAVVGETVAIDMSVSHLHGNYKTPRIQIHTYGVESGLSCSSSHTCQISFPCSGIFLVEGQYSFQDGMVYSVFKEIVVRKHGDTSNETSLLMSNLFYHNGLRTISRDQWRSPSSLQQAKAMGWSEEYFMGNDVQAERLFDYRMLGPVYYKRGLKGRQDVSWRSLTCSNFFLAGGPDIQLRKDSKVTGHEKPILFVPLRYKEGRQFQSEYSLDLRPIDVAMNKDKTEKKTGCTTADTQALIQEGYMFDQMNQALIRDSYGTLSLAMNPMIAKELEIRPAPKNDIFATMSSYLATAARSYGPVWVKIGLSPLPLTPIPSFRVWFRGPNDIIATTCSLSLYHFMHEVSHVQGFHHRKQYLLDQSIMNQDGPVNPLHNSGSWKTDYSYSEVFDSLGCCSGDASLSRRIMNGWIAWPNSRIEILAEQATTRHMTLWPFDLPEVSKGQSSLALVIRMNDTFILVCGYRELMHWPIDQSDDGQHRFNMQGIECEAIMTSSPGAAWDLQTTLDFNLLKKKWSPAGPSKFFSLLGPSSAFYHDSKHNSMLLLFKGNIHCPTKPPSRTGRGRNNIDYRFITNTSNMIENYIGLRNDQPFKEEYIASNYSLEYTCASVSIQTMASPPPKATLPVKINVDNQLQLSVTWDAQEVSIAGITLKDSINATIHTAVSEDIDHPIQPPFQHGQKDCHDNKKPQKKIFHLSVLAWDGREALATIQMNIQSVSKVTIRFSNNYDAPFQIDEIGLYLYVRNEASNYRVPSESAEGSLNTENGGRTKVSMVSLGCPKNTVDGEVLLGDLFRQGFDITEDHEDSDAIVINTCGFVEDAKADSIENIIQAAKLKEDGRVKKLIVTGCLAQRYNTELAEQIPEIDLVMGFENYGSMSSSLREVLDSPPDVDAVEYQNRSRVQVGESTVAFRPEFDRYRLTPKHTAYLRVAEGCNHACSFCAIPGFRCGIHDSYYMTS